MPRKGFHTCRLMDPNEFEKGSFRTISSGHGPTRVRLIIARPKGKKATRAQSILYPMDVWSEAKARSHCASYKGTFESGVTAALESVSDLVELGLSEADVESLRSGEEVIVDVELAVKASDFKATPFADLPVTEDDFNPNGQSMSEIMTEVLGSGNDWAAMKQAHLLYAPGADEGGDPPTQRGAYKLPIARRKNGTLTVYLDQLAAAMAVLNGARGGVDAPASARSAAWEHGVRYYRKAKQEPPTRKFSLESDEMSDLLLDIQTGDVLAVSQKSKSGIQERNGLIWKELLITGSWPGNDAIPPLTITKGMLEDIKAAFDANVIPWVDVPSGGDHAPDAVDTNSGFVKAVELRDEANGGTSLWVGIKFTDSAIEAKIRDGSIANVSARIERNFTDPMTGDTWPWVLWHVLLTNKPVLKGLKPFIAASLAGVDILAWRKQEVEGMDPKTKAEGTGERTLSASGAVADPEAATDETSGDGAETQTSNQAASGESGAQEHSDPAATPLTDEERERIREEERERIRAEVEAEYDSALTEVRSRLERAESLAMSHRTKLHNETVKQILLALQGRSEHDRVKVPAGHAFAPAIIKHVEPLLRGDVGEDASVKLSIGGKEQEKSVTELVLGVLNAVAEAGDGAVISLAQHGVQSHDAPGTGDGTSLEEKDAQVDAYLKERGLEAVS